MTHHLAALLKDVPRYRLTGYDAGTQPDGAGDYVAYHEVLAALEAAHHVNETPKSEHDGADVLTALPADVAGVVKELVEAAKAMLDRHVLYCGGPGLPHAGHTDEKLFNRLSAALAKLEGGE